MKPECTPSLSPKRTIEVVRYGFNFTDLLAMGETISTATFIMATTSASDPSPQDMILGPPITSLAPIVRTLVQGGVAEVTYSFGVRVTTSLGQTIKTETALLVTEGTA